MDVNLRLFNTAAMALWLANIPAGFCAAEANEQLRPPATQKLSLSDAITLALADNSALARAERNASMAELQGDNAKAQFLPRADISISANQSARGSIFRSSEFVANQGLSGSFLSGIQGNFSVPIDLSGVIARQVQQAKFGETIARTQSEDARAGTIAQVQLAFVQAAQSQARLDMERRLLVGFTSFIAAARQRDIDILPFLLNEYSASQQMLRQYEAQADAAESAFKQVLGIEPEITLTLDDVPTVQSLTINTAAKVDLGLRAEIKNARIQVDQSRLAVRQAEDSRKPTLVAGVYANQGVGGRFIDDAGRTRTFDYGLNISMRFPLLNFDGGVSRNIRKMSQLRAEQAEHDLRDAERRAGFDLREARANYERARARLDSLPDLKSATIVVEWTQKTLLAAPAADRPGLLAQMTNARAALKSAEAAAIDAKADLALAAIRLVRASGRSTADLFVPGFAA